MTSTMSSTEQPRDRSFTGFSSPCRIGPTRARARDPLHQLVADVAGVEVREDEHVRLARHRAARRLARRDRRHERGVELQLAVRDEVGRARARTMRAASATLRERGWSALPLVEKDRRATRGGARAGTRARSPRSGSRSPPARRRVGSGFTPQSANTISPPSPRSVRAVSHQHEGGEAGDARAHADPAQGRAQGGGRGRPRPRHHAVPASRSRPRARPTAAGPSRCSRASAGVTPRRRARSR